MAPENDPFRYAAFISYRHVESDRRWAKWLHSALETYRIPRRLSPTRRIGRVFRDEEELPASADLTRDIAAALASSKFLIVICSSATPHSQWVNTEVERFRDMGRHDRIIALLIEGDPKSSFPRALCEIRHRLVDDQGLTREQIEAVEPLAADVRASRLENPRYLRRMARLRILSCILGVNFDDLRRRDHERRTRLLFAAITAMFGLMCVLGSLTLYAFHQKKLATQQEQIARSALAQEEVQRRRAEARFADVRQLANDFMFKFDDALINVAGTTPARKMLADTALTYLDRLSQDTANDRALQTELANSYLKVGAIQGDPSQPNVGDSAGALASFRKAQSISSGAAQNDVSNYNAMNLEVQADISSGDVLRELGKVDDAFKTYMHGYSLCIRLSEKDPKNVTTVIQSAVIVLRMASIQSDLNDVDDALDNGRKARAKAEEILKAIPDEPHALALLCIADNLIGSLQLYTLPADALDAYQKGLAIQLKLLAADPHNATLQRATATEYDKVGLAQAQTVGATAALDSYQKSLAIDKKLAEADPENVAAQRNLAVELGMVADGQRAVGESEEALKLDIQAAGIFSKIAVSDPGNWDARLDVAAHEHRLGELEAAMGHADDAIATLGAAQREYSVAIQHNPKPVQYHMDLAHTHDELAGLLLHKAALEDYGSAAQVTALESALAELTTEFSVLTTMASQRILPEHDASKPNETQSRIRGCREIISSLVGSTSQPATSRTEEGAADSAAKIHRGENEVKFGELLNGESQSSDGEGLLQAGIRDLQAFSSLDGSQLIDAHNAYGELLDQQGRFDQALTQVQQAVDLSRKQSDASLLADNLGNLANLLGRQGRLADAEAAARDSLATYQKVDTGPSERLAGAMETLGMALAAEHRFVDAESFLKQALAMRRRLSPDGSVSMAENLCNLGNVLVIQSKLDEAETVLQEGLKVYGKVLPPQDPALAPLLENLGYLNGQKKQFSKAESYYQQAMIIYQTQLPPGHSEIAGCKNDYGMILQAEGNMAQAARLYREAHAMFAKTLPPNHPFLANTLLNLGSVLQLQGRLSEAEPVDREALRIRRISLPPNDVNTVVAMNQLANVLADLGYFKEAEPLFREELGIQDATFPPGDDFTIAAAKSFSLMLIKLNRTDEARAIRRKYAVPDVNVSTTTRAAGK